MAGLKEEKTAGEEKEISYGDGTLSRCVSTDEMRDESVRACFRPPPPNDEDAKKIKKM